MKINDFFDDLGIFFGEDEDESNVKIIAEAVRDDLGNITEIRILNPEYEEIMVVTRNGQVEAISTSDISPVLLSSKKR